MIPHRFVAAAKVALFAVSLAAVLTTCAKDGEKRAPRTVVLVTLDTVRVDRLGVYGHSGKLTPHLDAFAATGARFERCLTVAPITLPAHASILSGVDPIAHGLRVNGVGTMPRDVAMIQEIAKQNGFATAAFVSSNVLERRHELSRGFDDYDDKVFEDDDDSPQERTGANTIAAAMRFLDRSVGRDVFLWVHLFDAHAPYLTHPGFENAGAIPYEAEIAYVDSCFGKLRAGLAERNRADAWMTVVADHGEGLGQHGESTHTIFVYDTTIHVPWLIAGPGVPAGRAIPGTVSTISLAPTLLDLVELPRPASMYGRSLAAVVRGQGGVEDIGARFESKATEFYYGFAPLSGFERDRAKLIVAPRNELYFPLEDLTESADRFTTERPIADARKRELDAWERAHGTPHAEPPPLSDEQQANLSQMGYLQVSGPKSGDDPKDGIERVEGLMRAQLRAYEDPIGARQDLVEFVAKYPEIAEAHEMLGDLRRQTGMVKDALTSFQRAIGLRPRDPGLHVKLAKTHAALGDTKSATAALAFARSLERDHIEARLVSAQLLLRSGEFAKALAEAEGVLELDPERVEAIALVAVTAFETGDRVKAGAALRKALDRKPRDLSILMMLSQVAGALGDASARCAALERAQRVCLERSKGQANPQCDEIARQRREAGCP